MTKIRIITDSASDIASPHRPEITVLPLTITFGDTDYLDGVTISHREFYEKLIESDTLPKTSLISPAVFEETFEKAKAAGEDVLVITLSGKLSGTYQSAVLSAADYDNVRVVDSENVTIGEQILVDYALRLVDEGLTLSDITYRLERAKKHIHTIGLLDTLEYLKKGGRISKTVAFVGGALSIKPVVTVADGEVVLLGKARGSRSGNNYLTQEIEKTEGIDFSMPFSLGYTGLSDVLLQKYMEDSRFLWADQTDHLPICTIGSAIGTHVGPNAIAVAFFDKNLSEK